MFFVVWCFLYFTDWWTDTVTWSLVLQLCCLLSDSLPVPLVDEQTLTLSSWSRNHVLCCLTFPVFHWLMNRHCHLVPSRRTVLCVAWLSYRVMIGTRHLFRNLRTMVFVLWSFHLYTGRWTDRVTWFQVSEPCAVFLTVSLVSLSSQYLLVLTLV